ncbi:hypothetical protein MPDQ_003251 [Monascus purpureus]|uniref:N-acetyl-D-glucosamine kinase n=1 Tax=Monascus purpureus TaxID=5098 RepID=A0A507QJ56_MONPU|nr:hypothetical protein MPDQ_003251 [Monascus purpureus]
MARDILDLSGLQTEAINGRTSQIDRVSTLQMCTIINNEDLTVAASVTPCLPHIARAIDLLTPRVRRGGRVVYVGAGTSGRLGILDSSEIFPTFSAPPTQFLGLIAGGDAAIRRAQEGAEDSPEAGQKDLVALDLDPELDSVIGIAASGRTPYVLGALEYAKRLGCLTLGVACVSPSAMDDPSTVDVMMSPLPGPEIVTGSTRLKAGTATKLVLNMLSTGTMIKVGKTYGNMMVDLNASNLKLKQRSRNILRELSQRCCGMTDASLDELLVACGGSVKLALVVAEKGLTVDESKRRLEEAQGVLARVLATDDRVHSDKALVNGVNGSKPKDPVLCIDGGGSKCAAVLGTATGVTSRGVAGPCNLTDGHFESTMDSVVTAAHRAVESLSPAEDGVNVPDSRPAFSTVWIGTAGMDRPGMRERVREALSRKLGLDESTRILITNDVDLLAAAMKRHPETSSSIVVIAGTGSIAIRYAQDVDGQAPRRVARSGGWGHLLGDEGAGYAIGRQAIRQALTSIENLKLCRRRSPTLSPLEQKIVAHFHGSSLGKQYDVDDIDLLSSVLAPTDEKSAKSRIAGVTQAVLNEAADGDAEAIAIVSDQVSDFVDTTLTRLLDPQSSGYVPPAQCGLILSGGVMLHTTYQDIFQAALEKRGIQFYYTESVADAASVGVECLLAIESGKSPLNGVSP